MIDFLHQISAVRTDAGWFDRSSFGRLAVTGADRCSWLQGMVSNDVRLLDAGPPTRLQACLLDPTGHILSDLALIDVPKGVSIAGSVAEPPFIMIETPPGDASRVREHLNRYLIMEDAEIHDISAVTGCVTIQGPNAGAHESDEAIVGTADHTSSGGIDMVFAASQMDDVVLGFRGAGVPEIGPAAQEILRIEAGIPKYGVDMDATTLAPEAGLMATHISLTKGCYVGQEIVARIDSRGHTNRALTGLLILGETHAVAGERLFADEVNGDGKDAGWITSVAAASPAAGGRPIALGYVRHEHRATGAWLRLGAADSSRRVEVAELPFYRMPAS